MFREIIIHQTETLLDTLKKLEANKKRFLIVLDNEEKVIGTLVDGDIRRALISGAELNSTISSYVNKNFQYLSIGDSFHTVCEKFKNEKIDFLPIVDLKNKLINYITKKQFHILLLENVVFDLTMNFTQFDEQKLEHEIYNRPWGFYKSTVLTSHAQAKIITVFPEQQLSLQKHKQREEHWVVIKGEGEITLEESILSVYPGKYIYIPKGCKHRIKNTHPSENLIFSEVQLGSYFGEDDIIRYDDQYLRK